MSNKRSPIHSNDELETLLDGTIEYNNCIEGFDNSPKSNQKKIDSWTKVLTFFYYN